MRYTETTWQVFCEDHAGWITPAARATVSEAEAREWIEAFNSYRLSRERRFFLRKTTTVTTIEDDA